MKIYSASEIREIKKACTYRRLAEIVYPVNDDRHGMQWAGEDLCRETFGILYPQLNINNMTLGSDAAFDQLNKSFHGDFYWWE